MNLQKQEYNIISKCRISNSKNINNILNFGNQPLANSFKERKEEVDKKFPLSISYCHDSSLIQLNETVIKEILFDKYLWVTGTSLTAKDYIESFIKKVISIVCPSLKYSTVNSVPSSKYTSSLSSLFHHTM